MAWDDGLDPMSVTYAIAVDDSRFVRVVAGPGTGKSFALNRRVARLLEDGLAPERILPVTFTRVAAEDLQRELINIGVPGCGNIRGSTLHSLGMQILSRQHVLAVTGRVSRVLNRFELEPLLYDLPLSFGDKRTRLRSSVGTSSARGAGIRSDPAGPSFRALFDKLVTVSSGNADW
jgi:DNA helicase-2/ATP-dependent DNA helicase PcrA